MTVINLFFFSVSFLFGFQDQIISEKSTVVLDQNKKEIRVDFYNLQAENSDSARIILNSILRMNSIRQKGFKFISQSLDSNNNQLDFHLVFSYEKEDALSGDIKFLIAQNKLVVHPYENIIANDIQYSSENIEEMEDLIQFLDFSKKVIKFQYTRRPFKSYNNYQSLKLK
jgi:hypothetical protein